MGGFEKTKRELKRIPVLPLISYCVILLSFSSIIEMISNLGNLSYALILVIPIVLGGIDWLTKGNLTGALREDWLALNYLWHILIIFGYLLFFKLIPIIPKEIWTQKISDK